MDTLLNRKYKYVVVYECSGDKQRLDFALAVIEGNPGVVSDRDHIILQSRRLEDQEGNSSARILYDGTHYPVDENGNKPPQKQITNMPLALEKTREMLAGLQLSSH